MLKIKNRIAPILISPVDMNVGMVGVISKWSIKSYQGIVVMKSSHDTLVCLDPEKQADIGGWTGINNFVGELLIEVLPVGTVIEITLK